MSKELKCFERIKNYQIVVNAERDEVKTIGELLPESCKEVETALKDYEYLYQMWDCKDSGTMIIKTTKEIHDENNKMLKALEIIRKNVNVKQLLMAIEMNGVFGNELKLLKEVLL